MSDLAILTSSKITALTPLSPQKKKKGNFKKLLLVFDILSQFQKQAATPSAAAEHIYRVELHGLHANTIV